MALLPLEHPRKTCEVSQAGRRGGVDIVDGIVHCFDPYSWGLRVDVHDKINLGMLWKLVVPMNGCA